MSTYRPSCAARWHGDTCDECGMADTGYDRGFRDGMEVMSLSQAAESLDLAGATLREQIRRGSLDARKMGKFWVVARSEVERYRERSKGRPGRRKR